MLSYPICDVAGYEQNKTLLHLSFYTWNELNRQLEHCLTTTGRLWQRWLSPLVGAGEQFATERVVWTVLRTDSDFIDLFEDTGWDTGVMGIDIQVSLQGFGVRLQGEGEQTQGSLITLHI